MRSPSPPDGLFESRYGLVDALRGLAALAVVLAHVHVTPGSDRMVFGFGYEAVLVFFVISGYCIAATARSSLERGFAFRDFMWRRFRRIFPPYLFAIGFWAATRVAKGISGGPWDIDRPMIDWLQNVTLTQWTSLLWHPINSAAENPKLFVAAFWSLCYEEQFYLVMAGLLLLSGWFPRAVLVGSVALMAGGIAWGAAYPTVKFGVFIEYWAAFATGLLAFHRLCVLQAAWARRAIDATLLAVCVGCGVVAWGLGIAWKAPPGIPATDAVVCSWSSLSIAAAMALALVVLRPLDARYRAFRPVSVPMAALARISYSLYLTHQFCLSFSDGIARRVASGVGFGGNRALECVLQVGVLVAVASVFWWFFERPFLNTVRPGAARRIGRRVWATFAVAGARVRWAALRIRGADAH